MTINIKRIIAVAKGEVKFNFTADPISEIKMLAEGAVAELKNLEDKIDRLLKAQSGRGMPSEMENWQEVGVLVGGLHDRIEGFDKPQAGCGHKMRYVVSSEEGTCFCLMCAFVHLGNKSS